MTKSATWRVGSALALAGAVALAACSSDAVTSQADAGGDASTEASTTTDTGIPTDRKDGGTPGASCILDGLVNPTTAFPDYGRFKPVINASCTGTHHQNIAGVEKVVFLGDSITVGTPPTAPAEYYHTRLEAKLRATFGADIEVASCAKFGARTSDFIGGGDQIAQCFPSGTEPKKTLVIFTAGGNDIANWAKDGISAAEATAKADVAAGLLRAAVTWLKDPVHFPAGSFVVFANAYEYTDGSGKVTACPAASLSGFKQDWPQGIPAVTHFLEEYMKVAVETKTDLMFLFEQFCGHGYRNDDPTAPCYRGPGAERWFDVTCYHPNGTGHGKIADAFFSVIR
jgi:lysophospholipase L1-like esterase